MFLFEMRSLNGDKIELSLESVVMSTSDGNRTVLSNHMDIFVEIVPGIVKLRTEKSQLKYFVSSGMFHFTKNKAIMLVDAFESEDSIDFNRAKKAYDKAKLTLSVSKDSHEIRKAEQALKRAIGRLKLE